MSDLTVTIDAPSADALTTEVSNEFNVALSWAVTSQESYKTGAVMLREIKTKHKELDTRRKAITKPLDAAKKETMDLFRPALTYLAKAEGVIKNSMMAYQMEQERIRQAELAKAREVARKERERLEARAAKAREKGKDEQAQALELAADETLAAPVQVEAPKAEGISTRTTYSAEVVDFMALVRAVAEGQVPRETLAPNQKMLNQMARALKDGLNYPGVEVVKTRSMGART